MLKYSLFNVAFQLYISVIEPNKKQGNQNLFFFLSNNSIVVISGEVEIRI